MAPGSKRKKPAESLSTEAMTDSNLSKPKRPKTDITGTQNTTQFQSLRHSPHDQDLTKPGTVPGTTLPSVIDSLTEPIQKWDPNAVDQTRKKDKAKLKDREKRDQLYESCSKKKPFGEMFTIDELRDFGVAEDEQELVDICQELVRRFLFVAMTLNRGFLYKTRSYTIAKELANLNGDNLLVYTVIEGAGRTGMWRRPLENRTNLHPSNVTRALKELTFRKLINEFRSAQTSRRTYVTAEVRPDEKHIGGAFIEDGSFDVGLVDSLTMAAHNYILEHGWADQRPRTDQFKSKASYKGRAKTPGYRSGKFAGDEPIRDNTNDFFQHTAISDRLVFREGRKMNGKSAVPHNPSFAKYPTHMDVMVELNDQKVAKDRILSDEDARQLLAKLEFDGIVERMRNGRGELGEGYRTVKRVWKTAIQNESTMHFSYVEPVETGWLPGNGLSQVPCTRCPMKAKCASGGVVSPEECKYLGEWLAF